MMSTVILENIVTEKRMVSYQFSVTGSLQKYFNPVNQMFLEYNHEISDVPQSILSIPFVANVIPLIWITDSQLLVDELDQSFLECLEKIKKAYQNMFPKMNFKGNIGVGTIVGNSYTPQTEVASLFSGGLDGLATFIRNNEKKPLLITEFGWHEDKKQYSDVWEADKQHAVEFAKGLGLRNILIESNYGNFILGENIDRDYHRKLGDSWWHGLHHGLAIISAAIPMAYHFRVGCIFIASSFYQGYRATCASDPTVDNEIRFASGRVYHDGYELTRQDKVKIVVDYYAATEKPVNIRVCFRNKGNCCNCEKCLRTILGIVAEGKDPAQFGFNIPDNLSRYIGNFLRREVKFFTRTNIMIWNLIKARMAVNATQISHKDLLEWFLDYDFAMERRKALILYRITQCVPILKRKINDRLHHMVARDLNMFSVRHSTVRKDEFHEPINPR